MVVDLCVGVRYATHDTTVQLTHPPMHHPKHHQDVHKYYPDLEVSVGVGCTYGSQIKSNHAVFLLDLNHTPCLYTGPSERDPRGGV